MLPGLVFTVVTYHCLPSVYMQSRRNVLSLTTVMLIMPHMGTINHFMYKMIKDPLCTHTYTQKQPSQMISSTFK